MPGKNNKLYKYSGKHDNQQNYKAVIEASMVYTPKGFTYNSPMSPGPYVSVNNPV